MPPTDADTAVAVLAEQYKKLAEDVRYMTQFFRDNGNPSIQSRIKRIEERHCEEDERALTVSQQRSKDLRAIALPLLTQLVSTAIGAAVGFIAAKSAMP